MEKYCETIMRDVRESLGLEPNETDWDHMIMQMSKEEVLNRVCNWNGLINYGSEIRYWIEKIYGVKLEG